MKVKEIMSAQPEYISPKMTLQQASQMMRDLGCGFLPISNQAEEKLIGVITDRDIAVRGVAAGLDPKSTTVDQIYTEKPLYCYSTDTLESAGLSMCQQGVYRLIVLESPEKKDLCGILTLGDIYRHNEDKLATVVAKEIHTMTEQL